WPSVSDTVFGPKVVGPHTQRDAPPMVGPTSEHTGAKPFKFRSSGTCIRFAIQFPPAIRCVEITEWADGARSSTWRFPRPPQLKGVFCRIKKGPRFQHQNFETCIG